MRAPVLNRCLTLEAPVRVSDGAGGFAAGWEVRGALWADLAPGAGREVGAVGAALSRVVLRIIVRAAPPGASSRPVPDQRFREGTRVFTIISVTEADRHGRYLLCMAEEETAT